MATMTMTTTTIMTATTTMRESGASGFGLGFAMSLSEVGTGTEVRFECPEASPAPQPSEPPPSVRPGEFSGVVLLVDDEEPLRRALTRILKSLGFVVHQASNAEEALDEAAKLDRRLDLVISDITMPGRSGIALRQELVSSTPVPTLFISGFTGEDVQMPIGNEPPWATLEKPFSRLKLAEALRGLLGDGE